MTIIPTFIIVQKSTIYQNAVNNLRNPLIIKSVVVKIKHFKRKYVLHPIDVNENRINFLIWCLISTSICCLGLLMIYFSYVFYSVAENGAEGCKDLMAAFAACVKNAAKGTS